MVRFNDLVYNTQENLNSLMNYHFYRNGKQNHDGSLGEVKITPGELREMLAQAYLEGYHDR